MSFLSRTRIGSVFKLRNNYEKEQQGCSASAELCVKRFDSPQIGAHSHVSDVDCSQQMGSERGYRAARQHSLGGWELAQSHNSTSRFELLRQSISDDMTEGRFAFLRKPNATHGSSESMDDITTFSKPMSLWTPEFERSGSSMSDLGRTSETEEHEVAARRSLALDELTPFSCDELFTEVLSLQVQTPKSSHQSQCSSFGASLDLSSTPKSSVEVNSRDLMLKGMADQGAEDEDLTWSVDDRSELSTSMDSDDLSRRTTPIISAHKYQKLLAGVKDARSRHWEPASSPLSCHKLNSDAESLSGSICSSASKMYQESRSQSTGSIAGGSMAGDSDVSNMTTTFTKLTFAKGGMQVLKSNHLAITGLSLALDSEFEIEPSSPSCLQIMDRRAFAEEYAL